MLVPVVCTVILGIATAVAWSRTPAKVPPPVTDTAASGTPLTGVDLFRAKGCATCHQGPGLPAQFDIGPNLANLPTVAATRQSGLNGPEYVRRSIADPSSFVVPGYRNLGNVMPALAVTPAEIDAIVEYLLPPS